MFLLYFCLLFRMGLFCLSQPFSGHSDAASSLSLSVQSWILSLFWQLLQCLESGKQALTSLWRTVTHSLFLYSFPLISSLSLCRGNLVFSEALDRILGSG